MIRSIKTCTTKYVHLLKEHILQISHAVHGNYKHDLKRNLMLKLNAKSDVDISLMRQNSYFTKYLRFLNVMYLLIRKYVCDLKTYMYVHQRQLSNEGGDTGLWLIHL